MAINSKGNRRSIFRVETCIVRILEQHFLISFFTLTEIMWSAERLLRLNLSQKEEVSMLGKLTCLLCSLMMDKTVKNEKSFSVFFPSRKENGNKVLNLYGEVGSRNWEK